MNSYPRQAKIIESLTSQISGLAELTRKQDDALYRQHTELMSLREKVLLLEQRPTSEERQELLGQCVKLGRQVSRLETELEIARVQATPPKAERRCDCPMCEARGM